MKRKVILLVLLMLLMVLEGCGKCRDMQACVTGCMAGMLYNGTEYREMELTETDIQKIQECQRFCDVYFESPGSQQDLLPEVIV